MLKVWKTKYNWLTIIPIKTTLYKVQQILIFENFVKLFFPINACSHFAINLLQSTVDCCVSAEQ